MIMMQQKHLAKEYLKVLDDGGRMGSLLREGLAEGVIYYSITTPQMTIIRKVSEHDDIQNRVDHVQRQYGVFVYHVIVTPGMYALLYVSRNCSDQIEFEDKSLVVAVPAAVCNVAADCIEFGDIVVAKIPDGLLRIC